MDNRYPAGLVPDRKFQVLTLPSGKDVSIPLVNLTFNRWIGRHVYNTFGCKPVIEYDGRWMFAELAIMKMVEKAGWSARWVEVYYLTKKEPYYLIDWNDALTGFHQTSVPPDSPFHIELMSKINKNSAIVNAKTVKKKINPYSGCWDVLAWNKEGRTLFIESKHSKKDKIQDGQTRWLEAGLMTGLHEDNFLIVEWKFPDES